MACRMADGRAAKIVCVATVEHKKGDVLASPDPTGGAVRCAPTVGEPAPGASIFDHIGPKSDITVALPGRR